MTHPITTGAQTLTAAGAFTGVLDTSALTGDFTLGVTLLNITPDTVARVAIEDGTIMSGQGADNLPVAIWHFAGAGTLHGDAAAAGIPETPAHTTARRYQLASTRYGATSTKLRATLLSITGPQGATPSITLKAGLEN